MSWAQAFHDVGMAFAVVAGLWLFCRFLIEVLKLTDPDMIDKRKDC